MVIEIKDHPTLGNSTMEVFIQADDTIDSTVCCSSVAAQLYAEFSPGYRISFIPYSRGKWLLIVYHTPHVKTIVETVLCKMNIQFQWRGTQCLYTDSNQL